MTGSATIQKRGSSQPMSSPAWSIHRQKVCADMAAPLPNRPRELSGQSASRVLLSPLARLLGAPDRASAHAFLKRRRRDWTDARLPRKPGNLTLIGDVRPRR